MIEFNGLESTGKSHQLDHIIRETCKVGAFFLCDAEHAHEVARMKLIGCDLTNFRFMEKPRQVGEPGEEEEELTSDLESSEPEAGKKKKGKGGKKGKQEKKAKVSDDVILEEFFDISERTILKFRKNYAKDIPIVVAVDSLAAIETALQAATNDPNMKDKIDTSAVMAFLLKGFCSCLSNNNASLIIVNQLRTRVGVTYGDPLYSYGGGAKDFHFSVRVRLEKATQITVEEDYGCTDTECLSTDVSGMQGKGQIVKNKVARPWRKFRFPFYFDARGIWYEQCLAQLIIDRQKWKFSDDLEKMSKDGKKEGNTLFWRGNKVGTGEKELTMAFVEDPGLMVEMEQGLFIDGEEG
jgi:RecA/RadA recombinase